MGGGGVCPDNAAPGNAAGSRCGGAGGRGGEAGEQQIRAPGNPYSSFSSSSSSSLCIRRGFDKKFCFRQRRTEAIMLQESPSRVVARLYARSSKDYSWDDTILRSDPVTGITQQSGCHSLCSKLQG